MVREVLPWVLLSRFHNVVLTVEIEGDKAVLHRNVELYISGGRNRVFLPGASSLLYVPFLRAEFEMGGGRVTIKDVEASVKGYTFNGEPTVIRSVAKRVKGKPIHVRGRFSEFHAMNVARWMVRVEAGKVFAGLNKRNAEKSGWRFTHVGEGTVENVVYEEAGHYAEKDVKTNLYSVRTPWDEVYTSPGIVPALLKGLAKKPDEVIGPDRYGELEPLLGDIRSLGMKFTDVALLSSTSRGKFTYIVGKIDPAYARGRPYVKLGATRPHRNVWFTLYATREGNIVAVVTLYPFVPPAVVVLNYPPFDIAPLAAAFYSGIKYVDRLERSVRKKLEREGVEYELYLDDLKVLSEAGVRAYQLKEFLKEGYPSVEAVRGLLDRLARLEDVADVVSLTYGEKSRVERLLVANLAVREQEKEEVREEEALL